MDNNQLQYIKIQSQYAGKVEQFEKCIVKAAKLTHAIADTAEKKCKQARIAMESGNRDVRIQLVDGNTYAQLSAVDLIQQLHCVITLVYKDTALKTVNKEAFRECVKSLLKQSKMFTDKELDAMFA